MVILKRVFAPAIVGNREVGPCSEVIGCVRLGTSGTTLTRSYVTTTAWFAKLSIWETGIRGGILERFVRNCRDIRFVSLRDYGGGYKIGSITNGIFQYVL